MEEITKATFCKTRAGQGFKIAVNNTWLYVNKELLSEVIHGLTTSCQFSTYKKEDKE